VLAGHPQRTERLEVALRQRQHAADDVIHQLLSVDLVAEADVGHQLGESRHELDHAALDEDRGERRLRHALLGELEGGDDLLLRRGLLLAGRLVLVEPDVVLLPFGVVVVAPQLAAPRGDRLQSHGDPDRVGELKDQPPPVTGASASRGLDALGELLEGLDDRVESEPERLLLARDRELQVSGLAQNEAVPDVLREGLTDPGQDLLVLSRGLDDDRRRTLRLHVTLGDEGEKDVHGRLVHASDLSLLVHRRVEERHPVACVPVGVVQPGLTRVDGLRLEAVRRENDAGLGGHKTFLWSK